MPRQLWPQWAPRQAAKARHRYLRLLLMLIVAAVLLLPVAGLGVVWWATNHYGGQVARIHDAFPQGPRPPREEGPHGGTTFLLVGVDSRSHRPTTGTEATAALWKYGAQRSDTLMLVHLTSGDRYAYTVSIPRDSWVPIPGHGHAKINAAFSWGGPALMVQTVEQLTGARIDHFGIVDWRGFRTLTNEVGGVPLTIAENSYDPEQHRRFTAGTRTLNGDEALAYVRQRHGLANGDLGRIAHQQQFLRSLMTRIAGDVGVTDPFGTAHVLDAITKTVSVDDTLSNGELLSFALGLRHLDADHAAFRTAPVVSSAMIDGQSVLLLDRKELRTQWRHVLQGDGQHRVGAGK